MNAFYASTAFKFQICLDRSGKEPILFFFTNFFPEVTSARHSHSRSRSSKLLHADKLRKGLIFFSVSYVKFVFIQKIKFHSQELYSSGDIPQIQSYTTNYMTIFRKHLKYKRISRLYWKHSDLWLEN